LGALFRHVLRLPLKNVASSIVWTLRGGVYRLRLPDWVLVV
jgi:hypothetical protein